MLHENLSFTVVGKFVVRIFIIRRVDDIVTASIRNERESISIGAPNTARNIGRSRLHDMSATASPRKSDRCVLCFVST